MRITTFVTALVLALLAGALPAVGQEKPAASSAKADAILDAARKALGADRLATLRGLTAKGKHRRSMGDMQATGETELDITFPTKYLRSQTDEILGNTITLETGFDGEEPVQRSNAVGGGPNVVFRMGGPGGPGGAPADPAALKAAQLRTQRADFTRLMLGWFATAPGFMDATYSYTGEAESPDGRAEVIEIRGKDGFVAQLFIDQQTHRPLMLAYKGAQPMVRVMRSGAPGGHAQHGQPDVGQPAQGTPRRPEDIAREAVPQGAPPVVDMQWYFDDYRKVGDVWLPHRMSRSVNGQPNEEIEFDKIQIK